MDEFEKDAAPQSTQRRTVLKAAAWGAPAVAIATAVPSAKANVPSPEPVEAVSVGGTTTSPFVNAVGLIRPFGIDDAGAAAFFPDGQTFTIQSADLDFSSIITGVSGGTVTASGAGTWLITPNPGVTSVDINFNSPIPGTYSLISNGPVEQGNSWQGAVRPR